MNTEISNKIQEISNSTRDGAKALTKEQIEFLTDKLSDFSGFSGNPFHKNNCCFQEYKLESNCEDNKTFVSLFTHAPWEANFSIENDFFGQVVDLGPELGGKIAYYPRFKITIGGEAGEFTCDNIDLLNLQFIKCCIDAMLKMYEDCKIEIATKDTPDSMWNKQALFLPDKEQIKKIQNGVSDLFQACGGIAKFGSD